MIDQTQPPDDPFPEDGHFKDRRAWFRRWLEGRSREDCTLIAARAALRVLPNLNFILPKNIHSETARAAAKDIVLPSTRCHVLSAAVPLAPTAERTAFRNAAAAYAAAADAVDATTAFYDAAFDVADADYTAAGVNAANAAHAAAYAASAANAANAAYTAANAAYAAHTVNALNAANAAYAAAFEADIALLDGSLKARKRLAARPLWLNPDGAPKEIVENWNRFSAQLRALGEDWDVWADWYGGGTSNGKPFPGVLQGAQKRRYIFGLPTARALKLWHDLALLDNALWKGEPAALNARFKDLVKEAREEEEEQKQEEGIPTLPMPKPSAIEPVWEDGRLILPALAAPLDGDRENGLAALLALKQDFGELVDDIKGEANIDARAIRYLARLAERIPDKPPTNLELHRIAQNESALLSYGKKVTEEWPDFLAVRYHALALHFTQAMAQFPHWRDFKRIAKQGELTPDQAEAAPQYARDFAEEFLDKALGDVVDPAIPKALAAFADLGEDGEGDAIALGKDMLAADLLNSMETILIRLAEAALAFAKGTGRLANKAWGEFAKRAEKSIVERAGKAGEAVGPSIAKTLKHCLYGGAAYMIGPPIISRLITTYPSTFAWIENIIKLLH